MKSARSRKSSSEAPLYRPLAASALLREGFPAVVDILIHRRRADLLQAGSIEAYVELDWLMWHGGDLKLTVVGQNICAQHRKASEA